MESLFCSCFRRAWSLFLLIIFGSLVSGDCRLLKHWFFLGGGADLMNYMWPSGAPSTKFLQGAPGLPLLTCFLLKLLQNFAVESVNRGSSCLHVMDHII